MVVLYGKDLMGKYVSEGWWDNITLSERFRRNCKKNPNRVAVVNPPNKEELVGFMVLSKTIYTKTNNKIHGQKANLRSCKAFASRRTR